MKITAKKWAIALGVLALSVGCAATSSTSTPRILTPAQKLSSQVIIDGSSTVLPITNAIAKEFQQQQPNQTQVSVGISGTTGGFKKFCAGETDISNASRPILAAEMKACNKNQVRYVELPVAYDALTIAVHPQNTWAKDITVDELKKIWEPSAQRKITRWKQVRSSWSDRPLNLYGAGQQSGTYDYFTEAIVGKVRASRIDYVPLLLLAWERILKPIHTGSFSF